MKTPRVIYIAGYGRSGSTLLERLLNNHPAVFGAGELIFFYSKKDETKHVCACELNIKECPVWSEVLSDLGDEFAEISSLANCDTLLSLPWLLLRWERDEKDRYRRFQQALFSRISETSGGSLLIVDSSKTARNAFLRPLTLKYFAGLDVKMIHLVRDGRACMVSTIRGSNRKLERELENVKIPLAAPRTVLSWLLANLAAHLFQLVAGPDSYCRLRYEDLFDRPELTLKRIGKLVSQDFGGQLAYLQGSKPLPSGHQFSGNRLRSQSDLILKKNQSWKGKLKFWQRCLFWAVNWPLSLLYGYMRGKSKQA